MNGEFARILATEMKHYSDSKDLDNISRAHGELDELKDIMVKNIGKLFVLPMLLNHKLTKQTTFLYLLMKILVLQKII